MAERKLSGRTAGSRNKPDDESEAGHEPRPASEYEPPTATDLGPVEEVTELAMSIDHSSRDAKDHFATVDPRDIVERVAGLPISTWNYKSDDPSVRHIGPMAQDFAAAFGVGSDDRHINSVDANGVALASIQALHERVAAQAEEIDRLRSELEAVKASAPLI